MLESWGLWDELESTQYPDDDSDGIIKRAKKRRIFDI